MAKVTLKKKADTEATSTLGEVRHYARKIWLAGLGAYAKAGHEGADYIKELIKTGEAAEKKGKEVIDQELDAANSQLEEVQSDATLVKGKLSVQLDKIEKAFDNRVASALNRIGIPSKHDVESLSVKLDELMALLERVADEK